jgi:hypothetical protein
MPPAMNSLRIGLVLAALTVTACKKDEAPAALPPTPVAQVAPADGNIHGTVAERLDVPNYTYLRLTTAAGDTWTAVPTNAVPVGTEVTILNPTAMRQFESKTLNRTFEVIMFGSAAQVGNAPAGAAAAPAVANPHGAMGAAGAADLANIKVEKASGADGRTVAEVYGQSAALKEKNVVVHAKVVKVTSGVMNRNWLHVRDGSGTDAAQDNDLIITTADTVQVGDEVTATGVVHTDKDLGSGYAYKVLIEDAKITK